MKSFATIAFPLMLALSGSSWAVCMEGQVKACVVNGKHGTMTCEFGRWSPCIVPSGSNAQVSAPKIAAGPAPTEAPLAGSRPKMASVAAPKQL